MSELKPCPFCKSSMSYKKTSAGFYQVDDTHKLECPLSGADLASYHTLADLILEWNNRPAENKLKAEGIKGYQNYIDQRALAITKPTIEGYIKLLERGEG